MKTIQVRADTRGTFWVRNPEKVEFWKAMAKGSGRSGYRVNILQEKEIKDGR